MGILRAISKVLFSTAFVLSLTLLIAIFFLSKITEYSTLKQITYPLIEKQLNITEEQKTAILNYLQYRCANEREININIGKNISISCEDIKKQTRIILLNISLEKYLIHFISKNMSVSFKDVWKGKGLNIF